MVLAHGDTTSSDRFKELLDINKDVVGWIKIFDTRIYYPVDGGGNNQFYLNNNINKEIYSYGNMFAGLSKYKRTYFDYAIKNNNNYTIIIIIIIIDKCTLRIYIWLVPRFKNIIYLKGVRRK